MPGEDVSILACRGVRSSVCCVAVGAMLLGCSGTPAAVSAPLIDPEQAAEAALSQYDTNQDGLLSTEELTPCPALREAIGRYDQDRDRQISRSELIQRFATWVQSGLGVSSLTCSVTWKGRPLAGAQVKLLPEECFAGVLQPAVGMTDESGIAMLSIDASHLPSDARNMQGVQQGLYRIEIDHPEIEIPARYNTDTRLGKEVSFEMGENVFYLAL